MKFVCVKDNIKDAILRVEKSTGKKVTLPILNAILFTAHKSGVTLSATNLETGIQVEVPGRVEEEGRIAIPARVVSGYISLISDEQITFTTEKDVLVISTPHGMTRMHGYPPDDFPSLPKTKKELVFSVPAPLLRQALSRVLVAVAQSDIKPEIASVFLSFSKRALTIAATDSFRLAQHIVTGSFAKGDAPTTILLPGRSAAEVLRLLDNDESIAAVDIAKGQAAVTTQRFHMISRLTEGSFPDYERIIPTKFSTEVYVRRDELLNLMRLSGLFVGKLSDVTLSVAPDKKTVTVETANADVGEQTMYVSADISGEPIRISFNYRYLIDGLSEMDAETVLLGFTGPGGPVLMRNKDDSTYFYIAMPLKV